MRTWLKITLGGLALLGLYPIIPKDLGGVPNLDRRAKRVAISPMGRQLLRTFEHDVTLAQFSVIAELPAEDQAVIIRAIDLMARAAARGALADRSPRPPRV